MTTTRTTTTSLPTNELAEGGQLLVAEIERYLAARTRATTPNTAHPLVSKTTQALVDEALDTLGTRPAAPDAATLKAPSKLLRRLPDRALKHLRRTNSSAGRAVSPAEHLELTALVIERYGWSRGTLRTPSGRRCIAGAQTVLHHLGYGDHRTIAAAGTHLNQTLAQRGQTGPYYQWNDQPGRRQDEVLDLLRTAAITARQDRR